MNKTGKIATVAVLLVAVAVVIAVKQNRLNGGVKTTLDAASDRKTIVSQSRTENQADQSVGKDLPALIDLGAGECIPCKMMAPILEELKKEYAGRLEVRFIDVWKKPDEAGKYGIKLIPTQIFYDTSGKELFRHEGFYSKEDILAKWKEFGVDFTTTEPSAFERLTPAKVDSRPKESICYMCDGDIKPRTQVTVQTDKGPVRLCSPHCYFIMYSCLTEDKAGFERRVLRRLYSFLARMRLRAGPGLKPLAVGLRPSRNVLPPEAAYLHIQPFRRRNCLIAAGSATGRVIRRMQPGSSWKAVYERGAVVLTVP
jgi:thioredoxin 1